MQSGIGPVHASPIVEIRHPLLKRLSQRNAEQRHTLAGNGTAEHHRWWSGRSEGTDPTLLGTQGGANFCADWTSDSSDLDGTIGRADLAGFDRWNYYDNEPCSYDKFLMCVVGP